MFGLFRPRPGARAAETVHTAIVAASRRPALYGLSGLPDTVEGRFEALVLHALPVLRRLRELPTPAGDLAQEVVDLLFAHLEIALRETGVGDFGVPKRMKKLAHAFYDRTARYDPLIEAQDPDGLAREIASRLACAPDVVTDAARSVLSEDVRLRDYDLAGILAGPYPGRSEVDAERRGA